MATCNTCGKQFHACSSCGLMDWEWDYCSSDCYKAAPEREALLEILQKLREGSPRWFHEFAECYMYNSIYESLLEELLEEYLEQFKHLTQTPSDE